jgi:hypothetical protein
MYRIVLINLKPEPTLFSKSSEHTKESWELQQKNRHTRKHKYVCVYIFQNKKK